MRAILTIGQHIYHDFSGIHGIILEYREEPHGYNYKVQWLDVKNTTDWYKRKVLRAL